ncbi:unnamed protein product [Meloidogyne enterolobii]|uniref:Uncharacterized protein n=1 Tax=Meloidogyne enterolobii TaxID=390850 RepID=A0ACB0XS34_MELEN
MLKFVGSSNLFKYFGQQSRGFTTSLVKLCRYNENFSSSKYVKYSSSMSMMNETNSGIQKEAIKANFVLEKLQFGANFSMNISLQQGISGRRTIKITKIFRTAKTEWRWKFANLPKLPVPEEAYKFVRILDEIIVACDSKKFIDHLNPNEELAFGEIISDFYDISLYLIRDQKHQLCVKLVQKKKTENGIFNAQYLIKINAVPWIRKTVAQILREYDDSEKLPPMPIVDFPFSYKKN